MRSIQLLSVVFSVVMVTGMINGTTFAESDEQNTLEAITGMINGTTFAESDEQNTLEAITDIEFRDVTDFHTYLPGSQISFNVNCNLLAKEFAIGFNTFIEKSDGTPADVNDVRNLVFLKRGSSNTGALIDAVNTGPDRLKLTAVVTCAKLLPVSLPTVPDAPTEFSVETGDKEATLTWEEPLFDGGSPITKYQISAMPEPHTAVDVFAETVNTSFTFEGLVNEITYKFRVNAVNEVGPGIISEIITGTPHAEIIDVCYNDTSSFSQIFWVGFNQNVDDDCQDDEII